MNNVGVRIKSLREKNGLSQKQFSERIMVSQSYLSRVERGIEIPNTKLIRLIALEFKVNTDWLSDGKGEPTINKDTFDYYDRAYANNFLTGAKEELTKFSQKLSEYNNAEISRNVISICDELIQLLDFNDDTLRSVIGEFIGTTILAMCEQLGKFSRDTNYTDYMLIKINCIDALYDQLNTLEDYINNRDTK